MRKHPGKVVTRYQFSQLFGQAWMKAMIPANIIAGFNVTGVFPVDRFKILPKTPTKAPSICERTGLKFIPLFTPIHRRSVCLQPSPSLSPLFINEISYNEEDEPLFPDEEVMLYTKRMQEGYDITTDERYNNWLSQQACKPLVNKPNTVLTKVLAKIPPVKTNPTFHPKTTARVLTSEECRKQINEKDRKRAEALRLKESTKGAKTRGKTKEI